MTQQLFFVVLIMMCSIQTWGQAQCNPDITPPVAVCDQNIVLQLDANGEAVLLAIILDDGSYDNCSKIIKYSFSSDVSDTSKLFNSSSPKSFNLSLFVTDEAGNNNNCMVNVKLDDCNSTALACNSSINISIIDGETVKLTADMILEGGPYCPFAQYEIWLEDKNGNRLKAEIDENTVTPITFYVKNKKTGSKCWGEITSIKVIECKSVSLSCNDRVVINVPKGDSVKLKADMFLEGGPYCPNDHYEVTLIDTNDKRFVDPYVNETTQSPISYEIREKKSGNKCWGEVVINIVNCNGGLPPLVCPIDMVQDCKKSNSPEDVGFPLDINVYEIKKTKFNTYEVRGWDSCDILSLKYVDVVTDFKCTGKYSKTIDRTWTLSNIKNEKAICLHSINVPYDTIPDDLGLHNYDGIDFPLIDCNGSWPRLANGAPDPSFTGEPILSTCGILAAQYRDIVFLGGCKAPTKVLRTWTVVDWCTHESIEVSQILKFENCDKDNSAPIAVCESFIVATLSGIGTVKIFASQLDDGSYDDCGIATISFDKRGKELFKIFDVSHLGKQNVRIYVTDFSGKQSSCITEIEIVDKRVKGHPIIGGRFLDYNLQPITTSSLKIKQEVFDNDLNLLSTDFCANPTNLPLNYTICSQDVVPAGPLHFKAVIDQLSAKPLSGISTLDLVYVVKYLLGRTPLNNIEKVAADVNCSQTISPADLIWIRSMILGKKNSMPCGQWKLLEPDMNNIKEFSPHEVSSTPNYKVDMVPVKLGDVTGDWKLKDGKIKTRSGKTVEMVIEDHELVKGQEFDMWVKVDGTFDFVGLQMAIAYNKDEIVVKKIESPFFQILETQYAIYDTETRLVLVSTTLNPYFVKDAWLKITIEAKADGKISEMISVPDGFNSVYVDENIQENPIKLYIGAMVGTNNYAFNHKPVISPNPFDDEINITLIDHVMEEGKLELFDMNGSLIYNQIIRQNTNRINLNVNEIGIKNGGMYYVKIMIGTKVHVERLVSVK